MTTLFLVIAAGYLVGEVNFKGFALGSGAVLFVGLACGALAPKAAPPAMLGTLGLLLFLYCVGIQYGGEWYRGLTSPSGLRANAVALCGLAAAAAAALAMQRTGAAGLPESLGMFAGATTSTPALQAVLDALGNQDAAVGYSLAYPLGVAGPILCMYVYLAIFKPKIAAPADRLMKPVEVRVRSSDGASSIFSRACRKAYWRWRSAAADRTASRIRPTSSRPATWSCSSGAILRRLDRRSSWSAKRRSWWIEPRSTTSVSSRPGAASWECPSAA
jgi:AspT/YidE/YbjL antiporter-like protein